MADPIAYLAGTNASAGDGRNFNEAWLNGYRSLLGTNLPAAGVALGPGGHWEAGEGGGGFWQPDYASNAMIGGNPFSVQWSQSLNSGAGGYLLTQTNDNGVNGQYLTLSTDANGVLTGVDSTENGKVKWGEIAAGMAAVLAAAAVGVAAGAGAGASAGGAGGAAFTDAGIGAAAIGTDATGATVGSGALGAGYGAAGNTAGAAAWGTGGLGVTDAATGWVSAEGGQGYLAGQAADQAALTAGNANMLTGGLQSLVGPSGSYTLSDLVKPLTDVTKPLLSSGVTSALGNAAGRVGTLLLGNALAGSAANQQADASLPGTVAYEQTQAVGLVVMAALAIGAYLLWASYDPKKNKVVV